MARRSGGGLILVLIGDHYHDDEDGVYGLASLAEALEATLRILDDYAASCELCVAALATRTARHFQATDDGDWRGHTADGCGSEHTGVFWDYCDCSKAAAQPPSALALRCAYNASAAGDDDAGQPQARARGDGARSRPGSVGRSSCT